MQHSLDLLRVKAIIFDGSALGDVAQAEIIQDALQFALLNRSEAAAAGNMQLDDIARLQVDGGESKGMYPVDVDFTDPPRLSTVESHRQSRNTVRGQIEED